MQRGPKLSETLDGLIAEPPYLLGVSGGRDSMVLWGLLHQTGRPYAVAHVNYGLRGRESDADEAFVRATARARGCACHVLAERHLAGQTSGIQALARTVRRDYFERLVRQHGYASILLAHHADDQLETLVQRFLRGAGPHGLAGMQEAAPPYFRPLLRDPGTALAAYAKTHGVAFRDDSSNAKLDYQRNRVRRGILPLLYAENPSVWSTVQRSIDAQRAQNTFAASAARSTLTACRDPSLSHTLTRTELAGQPGLAYPLWCWLEPHGFGGESIYAVAAAIGDGVQARRVFESSTRTVRCIVAGGSVYLEPTLGLEPFAVTVCGPDAYPAPPGTLTVSGTPPKSLRWRTARATDTIALGGGGRKSLRRLLSAARLPPASQGYATVLVLDEEVVACLEPSKWAVGAPTELREIISFAAAPRADLTSL